MHENISLYGIRVQFPNENDTELFYLCVQAKNQLLPLSGATVYENVSRMGDVTCAKDPGII